MFLPVIIEIWPSVLNLRVKNFISNCVDIFERLSRIEWMDESLL